MMPVFPIRTLLMLAIPVAVAAVVLGVASSRGRNVFKKQGVAWVLTLLMVFAAIGIGYAKAPVNNPWPENVPAPTNAPTVPPAAADSFVWDNANVLSAQTERVLNERNLRLDDRYGVVVGVVTCNYGRDDLYDYAAKQFEEMGLGGYDMLAVLDIRGSACWLYTGDSVAWDFTDEDSSDYVYGYVEEPFVRGNYDDAVLNLTEALEVWYGDYYG